MGTYMSGTLALVHTGVNNWCVLTDEKFFTTINDLINLKVEVIYSYNNFTWIEPVIQSKTGQRSTKKTADLDEL